LANEIALARRRPEAADEDAYRAFCAALSESARGRAFLAEYARRNRNADTEMLIAALERLEALVRAHMTPAAGIRAELRALLEMLRSARPQIDARALPARAAKLAGLLDLLERRIDEIAKANDAEPATPPDATLGAHSKPEESTDEASRSHLAVVPPADEPELPIPSPAGAQPPAIALVGSGAVMPEVTFVDSAPAVKAAVEDTIASPPPLAAVATSAPAPAAPAVLAAVENSAAEPKAAVISPPIDPLAAIMALSEDERIALFT
jgi:hypothetical protein